MSTPPPPPAEDPLPVPPGGPQTGDTPVQGLPVQPQPPINRPTPNRWVIVSLVAVAIIVVVFFVVNNVVASNAADMAEEEIARTLGVDADVTLTRWPAGFRLLTGAPIDASISGEEVPLVGTTATLASVELDLYDVTLPDNGEALHAESVEFAAHLDEDGFTELLGIFGQIPLTDIQLRTGIARLSVVGFPVIDAEITAQDGQIVVQPTAPIGTLANITLPLPDLPFGFEVQSVAIDDGMLELHGSATDFHLSDS